MGVHPGHHLLAVEGLRHIVHAPPTSNPFDRLKLGFPREENDRECPAWHGILRFTYGTNIEAIHSGHHDIE